MAENGETNVQPQGEEEIPETERVYLTKDEYKAMVNDLSTSKLRLQEAEAARTVRESTEQQPHPRQPQPTPPGQPAYVDFDSMSKEELAKFVFVTTQKHITETQIKPVMEAMLTMMVKDEIRDCQDKYKDDFVEVADKVRDYATKNPNVSIEEAYHLVRAKNPKTEKAEVKEGDTPIPKPRVMGERPGVGRSSVRENPQMSSRQAAQKALDEMGKAFE